MSNRRALLKEVIVWSGSLVDRTVWHFKSGAKDKYGDKGGNRHVFALNGEYIVEIVTQQGSSCDGIQLVTNAGRRSEWFGGRGGSPQTFRAQPGMEIVGVNVAHGRCPRVDGLQERPIHHKLQHGGHHGGGNHGHGGHHEQHHEQHANEAHHQPPPHGRVTKVEVNAGSLIDKTTFHFDNNEQRAYGAGNGGDRHCFDLHHNEYITEVHARIGGKTDQISFKLNTGRHSQRYGGNGGNETIFRASPGQQISGLRVANGNCPKVLGVIERPAAIHQQPHHGNHGHHGEHHQPHHKPAANMAGMTQNMGNMGFGGNTSTMAPGRRVTQIEVYAGGMIDQVHMYYDQGAPLKTRENGGQRQLSLVLNPGEVITCVNTMVQGQNMVGLQFMTSHNRTSPWYGQRNGQPRNYAANPGMCIMGLQVANGSCPQIIGVNQEMMGGQPPMQNVQMPGGSWVRAARSQHIQGNILKCELKNLHNQWTPASVMVRPGQRFGNDNGTFVLEGTN